MARRDPRQIALRKLRRGFRRIDTDGLYTHLNADYLSKGIGDHRSSVFIAGWIDGARAADRGDAAPAPTTPAGRDPEHWAGRCHGHAYAREH